MRIIAGRYRGRPLAPVGKGDSAAHLRPTSDRVRESLFNILQSAGVVDDARVLDLFAGTGALGFEALSRGAQHVTFVDSGRVAQQLILRNAKTLGCESSIMLLRQDAGKLREVDMPPFDLVFLDPPYGKSLGEAALETLAKGGWLASDAFVVWEENTPMTPPPGFALHDRRAYGGTYVTMMWLDGG
ncbi:MAG: 16S rRNA (guanine(966)-N(2))-methyltransferase RsmD [Pseudomonadota bacterium]